MKSKFTAGLVIISMWRLAPAYQVKIQKSQAEVENSRPSYLLATQQSTIQQPNYELNGRLPPLKARWLDS
jgi:hypothetical protein